jgi:hypothetical protein
MKDDLPPPLLAFFAILTWIAITFTVWFIMKGAK